MSYQREKDTHYHITLALILLLGILFAYYMQDSKQLQAIIVFSTIVVYIAVALFHHYHMHTLSSKIVIEYIAIGSFGMTLTVFLLRGFGL